MPRPGTDRTASFQLRLTPEESAALSRRAAEAGYRTVTAFARARLLDENRARGLAMSEERAQCIRALSAVGERLSLLVALTRAYPAIHDELVACLAVVTRGIAAGPP